MAARVSLCAWIVVAAALAGCAGVRQAPPLPLPPAPVRVEPRAGAAIPVAESYSEVLVRTFVEDAAGGRREVAGAECRLEVGPYDARFVAPGRVLVPVPRTQAPVLGVGCRDGALAGTARRALVRERSGPYPHWRPYGYWGSSPWWRDPFYRRRSGVFVGAEFGDPFWGWDPWRRPGVAAGYPDVEVILR